jgi:hypothetical protein
MAFLMPLAFDIQKNERTFAPLKASVFVWMTLNYLAYNESVNNHIEPRTAPEGLFSYGEEMLRKDSEVQVSDTRMMSKEQMFIT